MNYVWVVFSLLISVTAPVYAQNTALQQNRRAMLKQELNRGLQPIPVNHQMVFLNRATKTIEVPNEQATGAISLPFKGRVFHIALEKGLVFIEDSDNKGFPEAGGRIRVYSLSDKRYIYKKKVFDPQLLGAVNKEMLFTKGMSPVSQGGKFKVINLTTGKTYEPKLGTGKETIPFNALSLDNNTILILASRVKKVGEGYRRQYWITGINLFLLDVTTMKLTKVMTVDDVTLDPQGRAFFQRLSNGNIGFFLTDNRKPFPFYFYIYNGKRVIRKNTLTNAGFINAFSNQGNTYVIMNDTRSKPVGLCIVDLKTNNKYQINEIGNDISEMVHHGFLLYTGIHGAKIIDNDSYDIQFSGRFDSKGYQTYLLHFDIPSNTITATNNRILWDNQIVHLNEIK